MLVLHCGLAVLLTVGVVTGFAAASTEASRSLQRRQIVDIVVLLRPDAADRMRRGTASELHAVLAPFGAVIRPQHPGIADPLLSRYFIASGVPAGRHEELAAALLKLEDVEAAYVQPTPVPP
jgi:hypothetical protein